MAQYRITEKDSGIAVELTEVGRHQDQVLRAFGECQAGRCSCPTSEYQKLATMDIEQDGDTVRLHLGSKPGERFDTGEIAACLDYTTAQVTPVDAEE